MREKIIIGLAIFAAGLLAWNMNTIFTGLPDELNQGAIYRIIYFHVPANILGMLGFGLGMFLSIGYLVTKDLRYDALAASVTEVALVYASIGLATGSIWARIIWGVWWAWDVRLTSWLVCWLIFGGYLMLRRAVDEPNQRARFAAVVSVLGSVNAYISYKSIEWWNTQHPPWPASPPSW
jgi:heme exporter protein C